MKPYLREKKIKHFPGKKTEHNWWEDIPTFISRRTFKQDMFTDIADDMDICEHCGYMMCGTDHDMDDNEPDWIYKWIDSYFYD